MRALAQVARGRKRCEPVEGADRLLAIVQAVEHREPCHDRDAREVHAVRRAVRRAHAEDRGNPDMAGHAAPRVDEGAEALLGDALDAPRLHKHKHPIINTTGEARHEEDERVRHPTPREKKVKYGEHAGKGERPEAIASCVTCLWAGSLSPL